MSEQTVTVGDNVDELGPIDYLIIEFPGGRLPGDGLPMLLDLVDRKIIRIIDLMFVRMAQDGSVTEVDIRELDSDGSHGLVPFTGASSGLLTAEDLMEAAAALDPESVGVILVYENVWAAPLAVALRKGGAQWVAGGRIPVQALIAALDTAERCDQERESARAGASVNGSADAPTSEKE